LRWAGLKMSALAGKIAVDGRTRHLSIANCDCEMRTTVPGHCVGLIRDGSVGFRDVSDRHLEPGGK
jgi:hypothetical protein